MWQRYVRGWRLVAGLIAIASAVAVIAWYLARTSKIDATVMTAYFPEREATVAYLDVAAIRDSGILDKIMGSTVGEEPEYRAFLRQTGFDYKHDLDRVMVNSAGGVHYFLVQGRFDWDKLRSYAQQQGGTCKGDECSMRGSIPERVISFRPLRRNLMALASGRDEAGARAIEQRRAGKPPFAIPSQPVWVQLPSQALRSSAPLPAGTKLFARALEPAERIVFTLGPVQDKFDLVMDVACRNAEQAAVLRAQLEGLTSLLQKLISREKQQPNPKDLSSILTSGSFVRSESHVFGKWVIQRQFLETLGGS